MNCNHENQNQNFCGNCGAALKEKCAECGEMEPIGRKICKTLLLEARRKLMKYKSDFWSPMVNKTFNSIMLNLGIIMIIGFPLFVCFVTGPEITVAEIIGGISTLVLMFSTGIKSGVSNTEKLNKHYRKVLGDFFILYPEYKEILKDEEKGEKP